MAPCKRIRKLRELRSEETTKRMKKYNIEREIMEKRKSMSALVLFKARREPDMPSLNFGSCSKFLLTGRSRVQQTPKTMFLGVVLLNDHL
jgi:hypothetical protein